MAAPLSLVLLTVDCLRADHVGFLGYPRPTTPFLDGLATESLVFHNAIVGGVPTYDSFPVIMASRHPFMLGRDVIGLTPEEPTLATTLSESGYVTAAFSAANPYLSPRFGYSLGFDTFRDFLESPVEASSHSDRGWYSRVNRRLAEFSHSMGPLGSIYDELYFRYGQRRAAQSPQSMEGLRRFPAADVIVGQATEWLAGVSGRPFFLWVHFMDPHAPYYPPERALALLGENRLDAGRAQYLNSYWNRGGLSVKRFEHNRDEILSLYDAGIRWVDENVGQLVNTLRRLGLWQKSVLAVTADHGEEFLDHGGRHHTPPSVKEEITRVPFLLHLPQQAKPMPVHSPFTHLDLAPTLLDAVGSQAPASFRGRSRLRDLRAGRVWEDAAIAECIANRRDPFHFGGRLGNRAITIREARYKLVFDLSENIESLFDMETDPRSIHPLPPDAEMPVRRRLLGRVQRHLAESLQSRDPDARLSARLRDFRLEWANSARAISA